KSPAACSHKARPSRTVLYFAIISIMTNMKLSRCAFATIIFICALGLTWCFWHSFALPQASFVGSVAKQLAMNQHLAVDSALTQSRQSLRPQVLKEPAQAPRWAIGYGKEFWRGRTGDDSKKETH